ncbi:TasA family protein [Nesterenkonia sandarakina]|uniref:Camelysin-like metallo-endopeptidase n=1 Tax=Nesterenkonia sandarakina TaxID=272918 RepID=A0A2T0YEE5_9MICC|nr:TasA family protein [Nesterenkonia sandarakina]PRZ13171.1 camelysin-like metallo-endopeptidase [Nesterenkonia sandarakina]
MKNTASTAAAAETSAPVKSSSRRRRVLLPLAGLLTAAALVVGSGADFTSSSVNEGNAYTTGTLTQSNSKAGEAIFDLDGLKPGDTINGGVTLENTGSLPASFKLTEEATNGFVDKSNLQLTITEAGKTAPVWNGTFGELTTAGSLDLGTWQAGASREFTFSVTLAQSADDKEQGKTATATYKWDAIQGEATTYDQ